MVIAVILQAIQWLGRTISGRIPLLLVRAIAFGLSLARATVVEPFTIILAITAALALIRHRIDSAWLIVAGGLLGVLFGVSWLVSAPLFLD